MIFAFLAVCLIASSEVSGDPCVGYETITDRKRSSRYTAKPDEPNISDDSSNIDQSKWYRFLVLPPSRMHDRCVSEGQCGTEQPIWINGTHPTADDPGPKEVQVCSPNGDDCCGGWESIIWVKFCSADDNGDEDFYVYQLTPTPEGDMAYCAGDALVCPRGEIYNPNSVTCTELTPKIKDPIFEGPITVNKTLKANGKDYKDFKFVCNVRVDRDPGAAKKGQRIEVVFTFDRQHVPSCNTLKTIDGITDREVELWSSQLKGHCLDKTVSCMVRSFWKNLEKRKSDFKMASEDYFVGLRYSLTNLPSSFSKPPITISVTEGDPPLIIYFESTVPISCPDIDRRTSCKIAVTIDDILDTDRIGVGSCSMVFNGLESTGKLSKLKVKALLTAGTHHRTSVIRFKPVQTRDKFFWNNYTSSDIEVKVIDPTSQMCCSSWGDPHITTLDGRYFDDYTIGDYILAKSPNSSFEVHVRQHACWGVSCNCGVAVREGNDVLGITVCDGQTETPIAFSIGKSRGGIMTNNANEYKISMPSGAYVLVNSYGFWGFQNIYVYENSKNLQGSTGMCGAQGYYQRLTDEDSLMNAHIYGIKCLDDDSPDTNTNTIESICSCRGTRAVACKSPDVDQNLITKTTVTKFSRKCLNANSKRRKRREVDDNETIDDDEDDEDNEDDEGDEVMITADEFPIPVVDVNHGVNYTLKWPTPSGVTEAEAKGRCRSKLESSPVFNVCKNHVTNSDGIIKDCVTDLQITDDTEFATSYVIDSFQKQCVTVLANAVVANHTNETASDPPSEAEKLLFSISSAICPNQCNGNGTCVNGTCRCNSGFAGDDCSKNTRNPPDLTAIRKGSLCDSRTSVCTVVIIFAKNFYRSKDLLCKITEVNNDREFNYSGSVVSEQMVSCKLPSVHRFSDKARLAAKEAVILEPAPFYHWKIALSNDAGEIYSNSLPFTVFDSKCQNCNNDGNCTRKDNTCEIEGSCYSAEEVSEHDPNLGCIPSKSQENWSTIDSTSGPTPTESQENWSTRDSNLGSTPTTPAKSQAKSSTHVLNLGSTQIKSQENWSTIDSNLGPTPTESQENWSTRDSNLGSTPTTPIKSQAKSSTHVLNLGSTQIKSQENWSTRDSNLRSTLTKSQENWSTRDSNLGSPPSKSQAKSFTCGTGYWCGNASKIITGDMTITALTLIASTICSLYY